MAATLRVLITDPTMLHPTDSTGRLVPGGVGCENHHPCGHRVHLPSTLPVTMADLIGVPFEVTHLPPADD